MAGSYRPERPVTSAKIGKILDIELAGRVGYKMTGNWKRKFKRRLPESHGWVRGYFGQAWANGKTLYLGAIAISTEDDSKLNKCYILDGQFSSYDEAEKAADAECKSLGVLEVMFSDD